MGEEASGEPLVLLEKVAVEGPNGLLTNQEEDDDRDRSLDCLPDYLGELEYMTFSDLEDIFDNEAGACKLQGTIFRDYDLNWCRING